VKKGSERDTEPASYVAGEGGGKSFSVGKYCQKTAVGHEKGVSLAGRNNYWRRLPEKRGEPWLIDCEGKENKEEGGIGRRERSHA